MLLVSRTRTHYAVSSLSIVLLELWLAVQTAAAAGAAALLTI